MSVVLAYGFGWRLWPEEPNYDFHLEAVECIEGLRTADSDSSCANPNAAP